MFISLKLPLNDEMLIWYEFQSIVCTIQYVDFIKTKSGKNKVQFYDFQLIDFQNQSADFT